MSRALALLATSAVLAVPACTQDDPPQTDDVTETGERAASEVTVTLDNGEVSVNPIVATGPVDVSFENGLAAPVALVFGRLHDVGERDKVRAALEKGPEAVVEVASVAGGLPPTAPDAVSTTTISFPEGQYFVAAFESGDNFEPAFFDVEPSDKQRKDPEATFTIQTDEFNFNVLGEVPAVETTALIENVGAQSHEVVITKGKGAQEETVAEFLAPAPREGKLWVPVTLRPGTYNLACYIPDPRNGKPHAEMGMVGKLTVAPAI